MHDDDCDPVPNAIYLIESGRALEMVKDYLKQRAQVAQSRRALCQELGVNSASWDRVDGSLNGVVFPHGKVHPDFTKPDSRGVSRPRKGSVWQKRFREQLRHVDQSQWIASEFGVPTMIQTTDRLSGEFRSGQHIGNMLCECGFLSTGASSIFGLWIPDVAAHVARVKASRYFDAEAEVISEPAASFQMVIPGCRRIHREEWEIFVLQAKLERKTAA